MNPIPGARPALLIAGAALSLAAPAPVRSACVDYSLSPRFLGGVDTPGSAVDVAVSGTWAYVADASPQLQILDISVPEAPVLSGTKPLPGAGNAVAVEGSFLFVTCGSAGLQIFSLANPAVPQHFGTAIATSASAGDVAAVGTTAYVACGSAGFDVVSVTTPGGTGVVATVADYWAGNIDAQGTRIVTTYGNGVRLYDATNPVAPVFLGEALEVPGFQESISFSHSMILGDAVYSMRDLVVSDGINTDYYGSVRVWDFTVPGAPVAGPQVNLGAVAARLRVDGSHVYAMAEDVAAGTEYSLWILDAGAPLAPAVQHRMRVPGGPDGGMAVASPAGTPVLCSAAGSDGLRLYGVADPAQPDWVNGAGYIGDGTYGAAVVGTDAYVIQTLWLGAGGIGATPVTGFHHYDLSDPADPVAMPWTSGLSGGGAGYGAHASFAAGKLFQAGAGMAYSTIDPVTGEASAPVYIASWAPVDVAAAGAYLLAGTGTGLLVLDPSPLGDPTLVLSLAGTPVDRIFVDGSLAIGLEGANLHTVDVTDPATASFVGSVGGVGSVWGDLEETLAVAGSGSSFALVDVSDPASPALLSSTPVPLTANTGRLDGEVLYVGVSHSGVWAYDISDPSAPALIGAVATDEVRWLASGDGVLLASTGTRLVSLPLACGASAVAAPETAGASVRAYPNPFRTGTTLRMSAIAAPESRPAVDIVDVRGRRVRSLRLDRRGLVTWDGRNSEGAPVAPGVYFVRFPAGSGAAAGKLVRLR